MKKFFIILLTAAAVIFVAYKVYGQKDNPSGAPSGPQGRGSVPVTLTEIFFEDFTRELTIAGEIEPTARAEISPKISGIIRNVYVSLGDYVRNADLLIKINDEEIKQELESAGISLDIAQTALQKQTIENSALKSRYERAKELYSEKLLSKEAFENIEAAYNLGAVSLDNAFAQKAQAQNRIEQIKLRLSYTEVRAPFSGFVENIYIEKGTLVASGRTILALVDIARVRITVDLAEEYYTRIFAGLPVMITLRGSEKIFKGEITNVSPVIDRATKTFRAQIVVDNKDHFLKPGMSASIKIAVDEFKNAMTVPLEAVYKQRDREGIFIVTEGDTVRFHAIQIQHKNASKAVFEASNISKGEKAVLLGGHLLRDGDKVSFDAAARASRGR